ncbi:hypothetical protein BJ165DRAFT_1418216 [Panaeolus papilionaceus]|nr:hypothetical protein BJ165DRAFT_1418216 [Panaeolus papilionaceus]
MGVPDRITTLQPQLSTSNDQSAPRLPPELERRIFVLAFDFDDPVENRQLLLVAKRICVWLRPEIYRIFFQCPHDRHYLNFQNCPEGVNRVEICQYARHILVGFGVSTKKTLELLDMCPAVEDFAYWSIMDLHGLWPTVSKLPNLRRLTGYMAKLTISQLSEGAFAPRFTHLELLRPETAVKLGPGVFSGLPSLTYLALWGEYKDYDGLTKALRSCHSLRVIIYYSHLRRSKAELQKLYAAELRMAVIYYMSRDKEDWLKGARGGYDMWHFAEDIVFARQAKYFETDEYLKCAFSEGFPVNDLTKEGLAWFKATSQFSTVLSV